MRTVASWMGRHKFWAGVLILLLVGLAVSPITGSFVAGRMVGIGIVIWCVLVLSYLVGNKSFKDYHKQHPDEEVK